MKAKILLVDDDIDYVESTSAILKGDGYQVITAYDGKEGLEKAQAELPQLMIIDLMMTTVNEGYDLVRNIRSDKKFSKTPLIMISSARQRKEYKNANFAPDEVWFPIDEFLDKPVDKKVLLGYMNKMLKK